MTVAQMRAHLNLDDDIEDDELLEGLITAAREYAEEYTKRCFVESTYELSLDDWPGGDEIRIPIAPLLSVVSMNYRNSDDEYVGVEVADYAVAIADEPPRVVLRRWSGWTSGSWGCGRPGALVIELRAGYAPAGSPADAANVPARIKVAIKLLAAHWYEHREAVASETRQVPVELPLGVAALLDPFRRIV